MVNLSLHCCCCCCGVHTDDVFCIVIYSTFASPLLKTIGTFTVLFLLLVKFGASLGPFLEARRFSIGGISD